MKSSYRTVWLKFVFSILFFAVFFGLLFLFSATQLSTQWVVSIVTVLSIACAFMGSLLDGIIDLKDGVEQQKLANSEMLRELSEIRGELSDLSKIREDLFDLKEKLAPETRYG